MNLFDWELVRIPPSVFVHADAPQYGKVKAWTESPKADRRDWKYDDRGRPGIWVALTIWDGLCGGQINVGQNQSLSDADLRAHYGREAAKRAEKEFTE